MSTLWKLDGLDDSLYHIFRKGNVGSTVAIRNDAGGETQQEVEGDAKQKEELGKEKEEKQVVD